jgi:hypothetical protein
MVLIFLFFSFFSCNIRRNNSEGVDNIGNFDDYHINNFKRLHKYDIDIDFKDDNALIFKILSISDINSKKIPPDLIEKEYFRLTELYWGRTEEHNKNYQEYWDKYFVKYRDDHLNVNNDYSKVAFDFRELLYEEIGYPDVKNVCIANTKDDLEFIENNYINSKYLQEVSPTYFEENIMVLIPFLYVGTEYLNNWKLINENNKYVFTVEIWEEILVSQREFGYALQGYMVLFIINIKK